MSLGLNNNKVKLHLPRLICGRVTSIIANFRKVVELLVLAVVSRYLSVVTVNRNPKCLTNILARRNCIALLLGCTD